MDCNCNQRNTCTCRPQMPVPPCMNTNCGCGQTDAQPLPIRPVRPAVHPASCQCPPPAPIMPLADNTAPIMPLNAASAAGRPQEVLPAFNTCVREDRLAGMPIAMGYVPWQRWKQTYSLEQGLNRGTIFPELDLPFVMGRCR